MKKTSKLEKNKKQLDDTKAPVEKETEIKEKNDFKSVRSKFACDCGFEVTLEGFIDKNRTKCSKCL